MGNLVAHLAVLPFMRILAGVADAITLWVNGLKFPIAHKTLAGRERLLPNPQKTGHVFPSPLFLPHVFLSFGGLGDKGMFMWFIASIFLMISIEGNTGGKRWQ